jgi:hypothetical protein
MAPMTAHRRVGIALLAGFLGLLPSVSVGVQRPAPPFRITALKAMLFYGQTGKFSPDLFGSSAPTLQNVRTGEGQATATLVVIEITGRPDTYAPTRKIAFTATAGGRTLLTKTLELGRPGEDGKFHTAFWLYDTGCTPIMLKARIVGQTEESTVQKTINFRCGD